MIKPTSAKLVSANCQLNLELMTCNECVKVCMHAVIIIYHLLDVCNHFSLMLSLLWLLYLCLYKISEIKQEASKKLAEVEVSISSSITSEPLTQVDANFSAAPDNSSPLLPSSYSSSAKHLLLRDKLLFGIAAMSDGLVERGAEVRECSDDLTCYLIMARLCIYTGIIDGRQMGVQALQGLLKSYEKRVIEGLRCSC